MFEPISLYPQLHMMIMHFPIALFIVGFCFEIISYILNSNKLNDYAFYNMGLGILFGIFSIITGLLADWYINNGEWSIGEGFVSDEIFLNFRILSNHGIYMILCIALFSIIFCIKFKNKSNYQLNRVAEIILFVLQSVCILLLIYGSHLGTFL